MRPWKGAFLFQETGLMLMKKIRNILPVALLLLAVFLLYAPGLTGGFIFDDTSNITNNKKIALESLDARTITAAFWSGEAGPLGRPISMLSFALNHYFTGFDPYFFKLTNLVIHLFNVLLVFWLVHSLLRTLLASKADENPAAAPNLPFYGAILAASIWGLHPLNMTSVLYAVQRMTSLSTLFGLLALAFYTAWRASPRHFSPTRNALTGLAICLSLLASALSKESGLLFVPLIIWVELLIFRGMNQGQPIRLGPVTLQQLIWSGCGLGALATLLILPAYIGPENFYNRNFTLTERLMTESRVMFYYLRLFIFPSLSELGLYHDDFIISHSLWQPCTTLLSILGLIAITAVAFLFRKRSPLWLFAWGWFLISHAMESTVFSLELVHEHRNYFATLGFLVLLPWLLWHLTQKIRPFAFLAAGVLVALCGFITWQRAIVWADPLTHAVFEAETHPQSARANVQLAHIYMQLYEHTKNAEYAKFAKNFLQKSQVAYQTGNVSWFALITLAYLQGETPEPALVRQLEQRLRENTFTNADIYFLSTFSECQVKQQCHMPHNEAIMLFAAAMENPKIDNTKRAIISQIAGLYFVETIADFEKGEEFLHDALRLHPDVPQHLYLAQVLRLQGKWHQAQEQVEKAQQLDRQNVWFADIEREQSRIAQEEQAQRDKVHSPDTPPAGMLQK
jgi:tetratricopeptide (TPR) repeat protein